MKKENCVFCKIVGGSIPSTTVYEDDFFKAIMDISPASEGHVIILSKEHADNIYDLSENGAEKAFPVAKKIAAAIREALGCDGVNILQNNGTAAGQSVFHFHMHVIPRYIEDSIEIRWKLGSYKEGEAQKIADIIRKKLNKAL